MANTTMTSMSAEIKFRNKFEHKIPDGLYDDFIKAVNHVNSLTSKSALDFLWTLTSTPEYALNKIGLTSKQPTSEDEDLPFTDMKFVPNELIIPLRNELRYQRKCIDETFGEIVVSEGIQDAFNAFYDATSQDDIICSVVLAACQLHVKSFDSTSIKRSIGLLGHPDEKNYFGGLRSLRFTREESDYLKPLAHEVGKLLSAMFEEEKEMSRGHSPFEALKDMSFEDSAVEPTPDLNTNSAVDTAKTVEPDTADVPAVEEVAPATVQTAEFKQTQTQLNAMTIVANAEVIGNFLKAYNELKDAGLNPEEVITQSGTVSKILEAISALT